MSKPRGERDGIQASRDSGSRRPRWRTVAPRRGSARRRTRAARRLPLRGFPPAARRTMPMLDRHYAALADAFAVALCRRDRGDLRRRSAFSGVWFLNGSYQWGCTARARDDDAPWLVRTLDWPFPGLGRHVEVARMTGDAGEFYSVTWPGFVGVLTAWRRGGLPPSINQAPMWRRTRSTLAAAARHDGERRSRPGRCGTCRRIRCCARCSRPRPILRARGARSRRRRSRGR